MENRFILFVSFCLRCGFRIPCGDVFPFVSSAEIIEVVTHFVPVDVNVGSPVSTISTAFRPVLIPTGVATSGSSNIGIRAIKPAQHNVRTQMLY